VKVVAFYLPQFHPIPENDQWWGPGFTEWTNTRRARPLFPGHYQPREPADGRYYSLLDPAVRRWQAELARSYGVDAFCYYHYWFDGRRLLERPFDEVLRSGEPSLPFCLSWANEPWSRSWTGHRRQILVPQSYGGESDWARHFDYLETAFRDPRYLRIDGKPVFVIYRPSEIPQCDKMLRSWRRTAVTRGLGGLYLLHVLNTFETRALPIFDGVIELEPMYTISHQMPLSWRWRRYALGIARVLTRHMDRFRSRFIDRVSYDRVWEALLSRAASRPGLRTYLGAFVDWDNSPRRGRDGTVFVGSSPEKFGAYFRRQLDRARDVARTELVFVNAWNEWAEGAYLEPDVRYGPAYLRALRDSVRPSTSD
jgi:lipopolysaccharide biosynthesis protein